MKLLKLTAGAAEHVLDTAAMIFCILLLLTGAYSLIDEAYIFEGAADRSLLVYRPRLDLPIEEEKLITGDQVAWIFIDGTGVDFPVMQGKDNAEYLNKDPYGNFSYSGSVFLDHRNAPDFGDGYSVLYGHHMSGGRMFGCLDAFRDAAFLSSHRLGVLSARERIWDIELFAVFECSAADRHIFSPGSVSAEKAERYILKMAGLDRAPNGLPILALTTCTDGADDSRLVVCGYLRAKEGSQ